MTKNRNCEIEATVTQGEMDEMQSQGFGMRFLPWFFKMWQFCWQNPVFYNSGICEIQVLTLKNPLFGREKKMEVHLRGVERLILQPDLVSFRFLWRFFRSEITELPWAPQLPMKSTPSTRMLRGSSPKHWSSASIVKRSLVLTRRALLPLTWWARCQQSTRRTTRAPPRAKALYIGLSKFSTLIWMLCWFMRSLGRSIPSSKSPGWTISLLTCQLVSAKLPRRKVVWLS